MECTITQYLDNKKVLAERIAAIDLLIDQTILLLGETISGAGGNIQSYELDDGQVRIKTGYRSIEDVQNGLTALERMKNLYINKLNGRVFQLRDVSTYR